VTGCGWRVRPGQGPARHDRPDVLACASTGVVNCERVTTSAQSELLGVPVALLGLGWFLAMTALCSPWAWRSSVPWIRTARLAGAVAGMVFVLWLVYAELFVIRAICLWCTAVHVCTLGLFVTILWHTAASPTVTGHSRLKSESSRR